MTKIRAADVRAQVIRTAREDELAVAAGSNTIVSKKEQEVLAYDLREAADEVRRRDPKGRVTVDEVAGVLAERFDAAVGDVNQAKGSGKVWLSKEERQNLVDRDYEVGQRATRAIDLLLNPPSSSSHALPGADVNARLTDLVPSLYLDGLLGSEGGEPLEPVHLPGPFARMPSGDELARALGHDPTTEQGYVERFRAPEAGFLDELESSNGSTPEAREAMDLLRGLSDLRLLIVGKDGGVDVDANHPTYVVGRAADGSVVGVKTGVIWT